MKRKFIFTIIISIFWIFICLILDWGWYNQMASVLGYILSFIIMVGIAILPGVMICFFSLAGLLFDVPDRKEVELDDITILIAAYNEEGSIYETVKSISQQNYSKNIYLRIIDNNSTDNTKSEIMRAAVDFPKLNIEYYFEKQRGKHNALNKGLVGITTKYFITIDADTYLYKDAIKNLVNTIVLTKTSAVAGTILVRNSRVNLLTKLQEWEYYMSIATIKRSQGLFHTTMVAQGAFSIYDTNQVYKIHGYKDAIAEDIVLTWELLSLPGAEVCYCDNAIAFTNVPTRWKQFARQRIRWARGSIEGFRNFNNKTCDNNYTKFFMFVNRMNIVGELAITFILIPGILLALLFHNFLFVGIWTIIMFIVTFIVYCLMLRKQSKYVFKPLSLKIRKHIFSFIIYILFYAIILSPICIYGYFKEITKAKRKWE